MILLVANSMEQRVMHADAELLRALLGDARCARADQAQ